MAQSGHPVRDKRCSLFHGSISNEVKKKFFDVLNKLDNHGFIYKGTSRLSPINVQLVILMIDLYCHFLSPGVSGAGWGATTFGITTFSIMTLSIKGLFVTLSIDDIHQTPHNKNAIMLSVVIYLLLC